MVECEICGYQSRRSILFHINRIHKKSYYDYIEKFPNSKIFNNDNELNKFLEKEKQKEIENSKKQFICKICGKGVDSFLVNHITNVHKITTKEYLERYPGEKLVSDKYKEMMIERNKSEKQRKIVSETRKKEWKNEKFKNKMKEKIASHNRSEKMRKLSSKRITEYNKTHRNKEWYLKHNRSEKMRRVVRNKSQKGLKNISNATTKRNLRMWKDPNYSEKMLKILYNNSKCSIYGKRNIYFSEKFNKNFFLRSLAEKTFIEYCEDQNEITYIDYENLKIYYRDEENVERTYFPDFLIYVNNIPRYIVEVKAHEKPEDYPYKVNAAINYCKDNDLKYCWFQSHYLKRNSLEDYVLTKLL